MTKLFKITGKVQNYAWGGTHFIADLLGVDLEGKKIAEYWLGAHINAPSTLHTVKGKLFLDTFLQEDISIKLGDKISANFGRLPFLFKVLDVHDVLSIQVHPNKLEAEKGFKLENELGIPLTASNRNYKDDNHKPEIMVALSEFWLLHGFLQKEQLIRILTITPELTPLLPLFEKEGYYGLYKKVMEQSNEESDIVLRPLVDRILPLYKEDKLHKSSPDYWAAKAVDSAEDSVILDKGIYSIYFFNIVKVNIGEAIFQDAGIPHAYLEGQNMELMANSDNVLRGGLTPKHIDVPELLKHIIFEGTDPNIMKGELQLDKIERIYKSPAPDFELNQITLNGSTNYKMKSITAEILMVLEGEAVVNEGNTELKIKKGEAVIILAKGSYEISTSSNTVIYKATAP
jgi:mannose-6-phosphate isomerase